jgi:flagellar hook-associated protein 1
MTQALGIGVSSLNADMTAIDTISENVANAQTPGYVNESADLSALPGGSVEGVGSGVEVTTIAQATNALLAANNRQAQGALSNLSATQETLTAIENIFPLATQAPTATTASTASASISGQLATFWSSWDAIAENPSSQAPRVEVLDDAQGLVTALHEAATQLSQITQNTVAQLTEQVQQVNTLLQQVASLNQSIMTVSGSGGSADQLSDQLQAAIETLSQLAGVDVRMQSDGTAKVTIGGVAVVQNDTASTLSLERLVTATPPTLAIKVDTSSGGLTVPVSSGSIAGLLSAANRYIPQYETQLNQVAQALANAVNGQLAKGYTATGQPASATPDNWEMFVGTTASTISVNSAMVTDPSRIAVSLSAATTGRAAANNGANAQAMAELGTTPHGPDAVYQTLVQNIGADTRSVNNQMAAQTAVATQAGQALQAVSGVNVTQELTSLLSFQQNYEASAKVLDTVDTTIQSLLQAV